LAVLIGVMTTLLKLTQRAVARWGAEEQRLGRAILQSLQQSLGGLKEVKAMGHERFFYESFSKLQESLAEIRHRYGTLGDVPRLVVETIFVCGLFLVVLLVTLRGRAGEDIVPLLGLYAYGGFRLIPSMNRVLMHLGRIRFGSAAIGHLYQDLMLFGQHPVDRTDAQGGDAVLFTESLVLGRVSYTYEGSESPALQGIDLVVRRGETVGIIGPTGAGKSTLINIILGLLTPSSGRVTVDGRDIFKELRLWQRSIGYVPQEIYLTDDSLRRNIAFGLRDEEIDGGRVEVASRMAQLEDFIGSLPEGLDTIVGERGVRLSGGQRQRVAIARALYREPELLIFDEATSNLDQQTEHEVIRAIEALRGKKSLIIVAHRLSTIGPCDRLVFLRGGQVHASGTYDELFQGNAEFREMASSFDLARAVPSLG
jgi:ATP-binding cassette subfamily C protein